MNEEDSEGKTPLFYVLEAKDFDLARRLVSLGADMNLLNSKTGMSLLSNFILRGKHDIVEWLLF